MEYQIASSTWRCARTGRELAPGEKAYSVLYDRGGTFERQDISPEAWQGPPPEAFSFWVSRVPAEGQPRRLQVDDELILDCLERLTAETGAAKVNFRYVLALLLMRRKRLRFEEVARQEDKELLVLRCPRTRQVYQVVNPQLTEEQLAEVQQEVEKVLNL
jgi:hypothetical protein